MTYEITLLEADIRSAMVGTMRLGLNHENEQKAELEYHWNDTQFTAVFHGHAPSLPTPVHPTELLREPIAAILALKQDTHRLPTDVFKDHQVFIELSQKG